MMRPTRLLCAIGFSLWSAALAGSQARPTGALPGELRAHVKDERFGIVTSIRGLPIGVREEMQRLFGGSLDIADPGAEFQAASASVNPALPTRRLVAAGCAPDQHCLVYYQRGGGAPSWRVVLLHWTPDVTRFEWGATAPGGLATIEDVRNALLSGAVKGEATSW
jgi:hypothetical protein